MSDTPGHCVGSSGPAAAAADQNATADTVLNMCWERLRASWPEGERLKVENVLDDTDLDTIGSNDLLDLIYVEFVAREAAGERPQLREFVDRFPEYGKEIERQLRVHQAVNDLALASDGAPAGTTSPPNECETGFANVTCPDRIGRYRIIERLGSGGQAEVFRAAHPVLGVDVVIKLARHEFAGDASQTERLVNEGRAMANVQDPRIARVYDVDTHENRPFLVMELLSGRTLEQHVNTQGISPRGAAQLVAELARGLSAAHRQGVTHRDVKPRNIMMMATGQARLVDFGVAELTSVWQPLEGDERELVGTIPFMAPEQARLELCDHRVDVFSLGAVLHWLLTGKPPLCASSFEAALKQARSGQRDESLLQNAKAPHRLKAICRRAIAPRPEDRYQSADQLADALQSYLNGRKTVGLIAATMVSAMIAFAAYSLTKSDSPLQGNSLEPPTPMDETPRGEAAHDEVDLRVTVWRSNRFFDLADVVPTHPGDRFRFQVRIPDGHFAALFALGTTGELRLLTEAPASHGQTALKYPVAEDEALPLTGPSGTVVVFVCVDRTGPITLDDVQAAWNRSTPLPAIPASTIIRAEGGDVQINDPSRNFGAPVSIEDAAAQVAEQLRKLLTRLPVSQATAFAHED